MESRGSRAKMERLGCFRQRMPIIDRLAKKIGIESSCFLKQEVLCYIIPNLTVPIQEATIHSFCNHCSVKNTPACVDTSTCQEDVCQEFAFLSGALRIFLLPLYSIGNQG